MPPSALYPARALVRVCQLWSSGLLREQRVPALLHAARVRRVSSGYRRADRGESGDLRLCANHARAGCNWAIEPGESGPLCRSCRLTRARPADSDPDGLAAVADAERAKRRAALRPALQSLWAGRHRPRRRADHRSTSPSPDDAQREQRRSALGEPYRHPGWTLPPRDRPLLRADPRRCSGRARADASAVRRRARRLRSRAAAPLCPRAAGGLGLSATSASTRRCIPGGGLGRNLRPLPATSATRSRPRQRSDCSSQAQANGPI